MQKISCYITILSVLSLLSCESNKKTEESETPVEESEQMIANEPAPQTVSYQFEMKSIHQKACEESQCAEVSITFPEFSQPVSVYPRFNHLIKEKLSGAISDYVLDAKNNESLDELITHFLKSYDEFKANFPESTTPWTISTDIVVTYSCQDYISMSINTSSYTGGAHSNASVNYLNMSSQGEKINNLNFFITSIDQLKSLAEKKFREEQHLGATESLSEKGFNFEKDEFALPENFGFTKEGLVFFYNPYEIAPYAEGPLTVTISFTELIAAGLYRLARDQS